MWVDQTDRALRPQRCQPCQSSFAIPPLLLGIPFDKLKVAPWRCSILIVASPLKYLSCTHTTWKLGSKYLIQFRYVISSSIIRFFCQSSKSAHHVIFKLSCLAFRKQPCLAVDIDLTLPMPLDSQHQCNVFLHTRENPRKSQRAMWYLAKSHKQPWCQDLQLRDSLLGSWIWCLETIDENTFQPFTWFLSFPANNEKKVQ